jgi:SpoVK/Ycf46/Vps4 family AAA+-type ATPase
MTNRTSRPRSQGVSFIPLDISEIVQSGVGDSERILAAAFAKAAAASPCMLFLDELQAVFGKPDDDDDSSSSSSQLLSQVEQYLVARVRGF